MYKKYIDAAAVKRCILDYGKGAISDGRKTLDPVDDILDLAAIPDMLPAAFVRPLGHCRDCRYSYHSRDGLCCSKEIGTNMGTDYYIKPDFFCAIFERRVGPPRASAPTDSITQQEGENHGA